jgi:hypothetical protein
METDGIKLDDNGVPLLDTPVDPSRLSTTPTEEVPAEPAVDLTDQQQIETLLHAVSVGEMLDDLAEDLQRSITVKIETVLKEEITRLVHQAAEQNAAKISEDIQTHLRLALPELLAEIARQAKD